MVLRDESSGPDSVDCSPRASCERYAEPPHPRRGQETRRGRRRGIGSEAGQDGRPAARGLCMQDLPDAWGGCTPTTLTTALDPGLRAEAGPVQAARGVHVQHLPVGESHVPTNPARPLHPRMSPEGGAAEPQAASRVYVQGVRRGGDALCAGVPRGQGAGPGAQQAARDGGSGV